MNDIQIVKDTLRCLDDITGFISSTPWRDKYSLALRFLSEELTSPCVLAIAGKVKAGKSYLVNTLLGVDLALTGTSETTATINVFKKGVPPDAMHPILCYYIDGHKEWVSKSFLDSIQGTSEQSLKIAAQIDKLVFYVNEGNLLEDVTLVDTPGIGADVGDDGDSHQKQTDAYFKLRERHQNETISLTNSADAVIYLFNTVPTETDKDFLLALHNGGKGLTSLNGIGILSKIDKSPAQIQNIPKFAQEFQHQLYSIYPTSSTLYKHIPTEEQALELQQVLKETFSTENILDLALGSQTAFVSDKLPYCSVGSQKRKDILSKYTSDDLPWSTFRIIAKEIYNSSSISSSLESLNRLAGFDNLKDVLYSHFFHRSKLLRCKTVLCELQRIFSEIQYSKAYIFAENRAQLKERCLKECDKLVDPYRNIIQNLVSENIPSIDEVHNQQQKFISFKNKIENLLQNLISINNYFYAYKKILDKRELFDDNEYEELVTIFSGQEVQSDYMSRYKYWSVIYNSSVPNSLKQSAAKLARDYYSNKLDQYEK